MLGVNNQSQGNESGNFVIGADNQASGDGSGNFVLGFANQASGFGSGNFVFGVNNQASGFVTGNGVAGFNNQASGAFSGNGVLGSNNIASGVASGNGVVGFDNIAMGTGAGNGVFANDTIAIGTGANAQAEDGIAIGEAAYSGGVHAVALGSHAVATGYDSTAIGVGATATKNNQMVFGTKQETYTTPGITSGLSKSRQSGPLEVVTTDADGNLASDGGSIFRRLSNVQKQSDENQSGVALAISMENPDLVGNERFGVAMNYGNFEGASALSWSGMGVLGYDVLRPGDRVAVSGGFGVGFEEGSGDDVWGGRVGAQWTWGRKPAPYVLK